MNKKDRDQLRASIAKDLVQGQGPLSPTRELLKHYSPLEGIVTGPTLARSAPSAWHGATVVRPATPGTTCHRETICHSQGGTPRPEYAQLQPVSHARSVRKGCLLSAVSSLAWLPQRYLSGQLAEAVEIGSHVPAKGPEHNCLSRKAPFD